jgi:hypothetical protein
MAGRIGGGPPTSSAHAFHIETVAFEVLLRDPGEAHRCFSPEAIQARSGGIHRGWRGTPGTRWVARAPIRPHRPTPQPTPKSGARANSSATEGRVRGHGRARLQEVRRELGTEENVRRSFELPAVRAAFLVVPRQASDLAEPFYFSVIRTSARIQGWMQHWYFSTPASCSISLDDPPDGISTAVLHSGATVVNPTRSFRN